jgi:hypothetical protein
MQSRALFYCPDPLKYASANCFVWFRGIIAGQHFKESVMKDNGKDAVIEILARRGRRRSIVLDDDCRVELTSSSALM